MGKSVANEPIVARTERGLSIGGTRITLYDVLEYVQAGWSPERIRDWLKLTDQQIDDVMFYLEEHQDEVNLEYQQVLEAAKETRLYWEERNGERLAQIAATPPKPEHATLWAMLQAHRAEHNDSE